MAITARQKMKLSIIIPFYNEAKTLKEIIKRLLKVKLPQGIKKEIIAVNDGSSDESKKIILALLQTRENRKLIKFISYSKNMGKGYAVRQALKISQGDYILVQDADLEYEPEDIKKLLAPVLKKKAIVVYGSRFTGERRNMLFWHMVGNKFLSLLTNILFNTTLSDMEVGYKLMPRILLNQLNLKENRFGFEPEVTAKILKKNIKIYEVPISYAGRDYNEGKKITWRDGLKAIWYLFKYKITN